VFDKPKYTNNKLTILYLRKVAVITIATLGPQGTFAELATQKYIAKTRNNGEINFFPTISKCFHAVGHECNQGVIPIENSLDGYVQLSLDLLLQTKLHIIYELFIPIQFSFVANCSRLNEVTKIYAQFKTQGQCLHFLDRFSQVELITTNSNGSSLEFVSQKIPGEAAIIPHYTLNHFDSFPLIIENVTDYELNQTRFFVISEASLPYEEDKKYKTTLVIVDVADEPGMLAKILNEFASHNINMYSIMSRPTKKDFGKYYFFIDIEGHYQHDTHVKKAINTINIKNEVQILGSYSTLE
jgi:prephenate dehydratase